MAYDRSPPAEGSGYDIETLLQDPLSVWMIQVWPVSRKRVLTRTYLPASNHPEIRPGRPFSNSMDAADQPRLLHRRLGDTVALAGD